MNWRWSLVAIVVALSLARWAFEAIRLGQEAARATEAAAATPVPAHLNPEIRDYPEGNGRLPAHYPTDVPLFESAEIVETVVAPRPERTTWNVVFHAEAEPGELESWYATELVARGWKVVRNEQLPADQNSGDPAHALAAVKEGRRVEILWTERDEDWIRSVSQMLIEPRR